MRKFENNFKRAEWNACEIYNIHFQTRLMLLLRSVQTFNVRCRLKKNSVKLLISHWAHFHIRHYEFGYIIEAHYLAMVRMPLSFDIIPTNLPRKFIIFRFFSSAVVGYGV